MDRPSGAARWWTLRSPNGCTNTCWPTGVLGRTATAVFESVGMIALQLRRSSSAVITIDLRSGTDGAGPSGSAFPIVTSKLTEAEKMKTWNVAVPIASHGDGPFRVRWRSTPISTELL